MKYKASTPTDYIEQIKWPLNSRLWAHAYISYIGEHVRRQGIWWLNRFGLKYGIV